MKNIIGLLVFLLGVSLVLGGCATTTSTTTTTSTVSTTGTTLAPGSTSISGTVTLPGGLSGCLWVGASTDGTLQATTGWEEIEYQVSASDTSKNYTIGISAPGTYYVLAVLSVGDTTFAGQSMPDVGDRVGEYSDGNLISGWGQIPTGTPLGIVVSAGSVLTGKDFPLNVTWQ